MQVIAAILRDAQGKILICQRGASGECANLWEFPGGKLEGNETPAQCVVRECKEELGIQIVPKAVFAQVDYAYPDKVVALTFYEATMEPQPVQRNVHQRIEWVETRTLSNYAFCPADQEILEKLQKESAQKKQISQQNL